MSSKIKISSIRLENYRQYYDIQTIEFPDRDDGFVAIIGENGGGKSNLLNAINWCFYKKEPHKNKNQGYAIINNKYLDSLKNGSIANMSVQIDLQNGDDQYRISRVLKVIKNEYEYENIGSSSNSKLKMTDAQGYDLPWGCEVIDSKSTFEILKREKKQQSFHPDPRAPPDVIMNEILPQSLSSYFILDGEFLEKFWEGIQKVELGVERISQLHLLNTTIGHLGQLQKGIPKIGKQDIDKLTQLISINEHFEDSLDENANENFSKRPRFDYDPQVDPYEFYHATGKPLIQELELDMKKMYEKSQKIAEQFGSSGIQAAKLLQNEFKEEEIRYRESSSAEKEAEKQYFSSYIDNLPLFLLKPAIEYSIKIVDDLRAKGYLPYEAKKIFTNDLLDLGKCICQNDLQSNIVGGQETNSARLAVIKVRDSMALDQGLDGSVKMKYHFEEKMLGDFEKFTTNCFDNPRRVLYEARNKSLKHNKKLKEIKTKLENVGSADIAKLVEEHTYIIDLIKETQKEIDDITHKLKQNEIKSKEYKNERKNLMNKDSKSKKIAFEQNIWERITEIFEKTYSELKEEIRKQVQSKTMEIFLKTMYKKDQFKDFIIKSDYSVELFDNENKSMLGSLSAGESLFLALSFISAIRDVTGYKFPLIIDTPLGRVSGQPRYLLSQALPKYLPNEQVIFLATDTEFLDPNRNIHEDGKLPEKPFGELLEGSIKMQYYLISGMQDTKIAKILPYNPRWRKNK